MSDIADKAVDVAASAASEIAQQAEGAEQVIRSLNRIKISFAAMGGVIGTGIGATIGFIVAYRRAETKYNKIASEEIAELREHYHNKALSLENTVQKPDLEDIVREQGYSVEPPMAVTPPSAVMEAAAREEEESPAAVKAPVPVDPPAEPKTRNVFEEAQVDDHWDYHRERVQRSPLKPYVIHRDEREENQSYDEVTFTYYEADDVLCNERDEVIGEEDRERLVGETNLEKFGHGSGDASIVYIRNDPLEMQVEVVRSPNSYAEEVHGFQHSEKVHRRRTRQSFDDE